MYKEEGEVNWSSLKALFDEIISIEDTVEGREIETSAVSEEVNQPENKKCNG